jgi:hypothetical protein
MRYALMSIGQAALTPVRRRSFPDFAVPDFLANRNMTDERIDSGPIPESIRFGLQAKTAVSRAAKNHCLKPERRADAPFVEIDS